MKSLKEYEIHFTGLKEGTHEFQFEAKDEFFDHFNTEREFQKANVLATTKFVKYSTFFEIYLHIEGEAELLCDISGEEFMYPFSNDMKVIIKFGPEYNDDHEEIIIIPEAFTSFNIAQILYEAVMLAIPMKKVSPHIDEEILERLKKYAPKSPYEEENRQDDSPQMPDPRWEALKNINNN